MDPATLLGPLGPTLDLDALQHHQQQHHQQQQQQQQQQQPLPPGLTPQLQHLLGAQQPQQLAPTLQLGHLPNGLLPSPSQWAQQQQQQQLQAGAPPGFFGLPTAMVAQGPGSAVSPRPSAGSAGPAVFPSGGLASILGGGALAPNAATAAAAAASSQQALAGGGVMQAAALQQAGGAAGPPGAGGAGGGGAGDPVSQEYNRYLRLLPPLIQQRFQGNLLRNCVMLQQQGVPLVQAQRTVQQQQLREMHKIAQEIMQQRLREWGAGAAAAGSGAPGDAGRQAAAGQTQGFSSPAAATAARSGGVPPVPGWGAASGGAAPTSHLPAPQLVPKGLPGESGPGEAAAPGFGAGPGAAAAAMQNGVAPLPSLQRQPTPPSVALAAAAAEGADAAAAAAAAGLWQQQQAKHAQLGAELAALQQAQQAHQAARQVAAGGAEQALLAGLAPHAPASPMPAAIPPGAQLAQAAPAPSQEGPGALSLGAALLQQQQSPFAAPALQQGQPGPTLSGGAGQGAAASRLGSLPAPTVPARAKRLGSTPLAPDAAAATAQYIAQLQQEQQQYQARMMMGGEASGAAQQQQLQQGTAIGGADGGGARPSSAPPSQQLGPAWASAQRPDQPSLSLPGGQAAAAMPPPAPALQQAQQQAPPLGSMMPPPLPHPPAQQAAQSDPSIAASCDTRGLLGEAGANAGASPPSRAALAQGSPTKEAAAQQQMGAEADGGAPGGPQQGDTATMGSSAGAHKGKGGRSAIIRRCSRCSGQYGQKCDWVMCAKCCREVGNPCNVHALGRKDKKRGANASHTAGPSSFLAPAQSLPATLQQQQQHQAQPQQPAAAGAGRMPLKGAVQAPPLSMMRAASLDEAGRVLALAPLHQPQAGPQGGGADAAAAAAAAGGKRGERSSQRLAAAAAPEDPNADGAAAATAAAHAQVGQQSTQQQPAGGPQLSQAGGGGGGDRLDVLAGLFPGVGALPGPANGSGGSEGGGAQEEAAGQRFSTVQLKASQPPSQALADAQQAKQAQQQQVPPTFRGMVLPAPQERVWSPRAASQQGLNSSQVPAPASLPAPSGLPPLHPQQPTQSPGPQLQRAGADAGRQSAGANARGAAGTAAAAAAVPPPSSHIDLAGLVRAVQREKEDALLWRRALGRRNSALARQQVVEAVERYKWNAAILAELFDGIPVDQAAPIAQEGTTSIAKILSPAAPPTGAECGNSGVERTAPAGEASAGAGTSTGDGPTLMPSPFGRQDLHHPHPAGGAGVGGEDGEDEEERDVPVLLADVLRPGGGAVRAGGGGAVGTEGQQALAAAVARMGGLDELRAAAAAALPPAGPPPGDARARQLWQQQQWLQGMSEAKRQRLADVALHVQRAEVGGAFNRACGAGPITLPPGFDTNQLLQQPGRTTYRL